MCGIAGLIAFHAPLDRAESIVTAMAERIAHRGPDGGGVIAHPDATLAMKRLAIVDVVHGAQPMANDDESIVLVYNGEIYNAPALRLELERQGIRFRTRSDTEVILRLYERNPERVEEELVGMWAFAIHDRRRKKVVLSRDRFGIKPLFIADSGEAVAFASELRCFDRDIEPFAGLFKIDPSAAHAMVSWGFVPDTSTIYEGVRRLAPATRLEIDLATASRHQRQYWELTPSADAARIDSLEDACTRVEDLLRRAVREHLESDVPVATFLSGGIDSSLITALAAEESRKPIKTYSIGFHEARFDESPYAKATAEILGLESVVEMFDEETARKKLANAILAYDEPFGDTSSLATYLLCEHVGRDYKVALGGDGGDEVFAGYKKYWVTKLRQPLSTVPAMREGLGRALGKLHSRTEGTWSEVAQTARRLSRGLSGTDADVYVRFTLVAPLARTEKLMRVPADAARYVDAARERFDATPGTELQRSITCDLANTLVNDMLVKVDRASMARHLEARVPFLDHRVVEFGVGLPERFVLGVQTTKRVLRALHERRFGGKLARRGKQGFGVPIQKWLGGPFARACERLFEKSRLDHFGLLSSDTLSNGAFRALVETEPNIVWPAFALAAWCEANLGDGPDALRDLLR
jgi:asparagine synthase (glutamine-hydrolysing)